MEKAVYWYQESATAGYAFAQNMLGNCFYNGWGIKKDWGWLLNFFEWRLSRGIRTDKSTLECVINMAGDHKRLGTGSDAILKKYSFSCSDLARISKIEKY